MLSFIEYFNNNVGIYTLWSIKNVAVNFLQQLWQILTDFDNVCTKLTKN